MPVERLTFPEWFTDEMKQACEGMTQAEVDSQDSFMLQNGCVPNPTNCKNCDNDCSSLFHPQMVALYDLPEIG